MMTNGVKIKKSLSELARQAEERFLESAQFPLFPESVWSVPNPFLRCSAFAALGSKGKREFVENLQLSSPAGMEITYTGIPLDQTDFDYIFAIWYMARGKNCSGFSFKLSQIFHLLDLPNTGRARAVFDARIKTMRASAFAIKTPDSFYVGGLVDEYFRDEEGVAHVRINPRILSLFTGDKYTMVNWLVRKELRGKPLAQWLHGSYSSHEVPFAYKVETLMEQSGSKAKRVAEFKVCLKKALGAVSVASQKNGQPFEYRIIGDLVHVRRGKGRPLPE